MHVFQKLFLQPPNAEFVKAIHDVITWRPNDPHTQPFDVLAFQKLETAALDATKDKIAMAGAFWESDESMRLVARNWRMHYVSEPMAAHLVGLILDKNNTVLAEEFALVRLIGLHEDIADAYEVLDANMGLRPGSFPVGFKQKDERIITFLREHAPKECLQEVLATSDGNVHDPAWSVLELKSGEVGPIGMDNWSDADDHLHLCRLGENPNACSWFHRATSAGSKIPILRLS